MNAGVLLSEGFTFYSCTHNYNSIMFSFDIIIYQTAIMQ